MAIKLHHLHPGHDDELTHLKARIAELEESHKKEVEQLLMEIAELKEERRWRKFPDEKPTKDIKFLVINEKGFLQCCYYSPILHEFQIPVTHWMPLPSDPKEYK